MDLISGLLFVRGCIVKKNLDFQLFKFGEKKVKNINKKEKRNIEINEVFDLKKVLFFRSQDFQKNLQFFLFQ